MNVDDPCFVDTDVLLYSFDNAHEAKQNMARHWLDVLWQTGKGRLSWQVLNEFYDSATRKNRAPARVIRGAAELYSAWHPATPDMALVQRAWQWIDLAGMRYWDALILASAERAGCRWLLSEDFQTGRQYGSLSVISPFETEPEGLVIQ